jgi:hypothetical protein
MKMAAPDLDLLAPPARPKAACLRPPTEAERALLAQLRDAAAACASGGRFHDAAAREWRSMPINLRMVVVLLAGLGLDVADLETLAARSWREIPPTEQALLRGELRLAKKHFARLAALVARV